MQTRTTGTPVFWGYPTPPHDYPYYWVILDPKSKQDKIKGTNLKNLLNLQLSFEKTLHATQLLKLLDKMGTYEMDPASIVDDTEWTHLRPQTDKQTDGQSETRIPPFDFVESGGIIICVFLCIHTSQLILIYFRITMLVMGQIYHPAYEMML